MSTAKKIHKNSYGYTLVEVLISAMIVLVAISAVVVIISRGSKINMDDLLRRRAYQVMEEVLERPDLSSNNYFLLLGKIPTNGISILENLPDVTLSNIEGSIITGTVERRLEKVQFRYNGTEIPGIRVTVTVRYRNETEQLSTIITQ